MTEASILDEGEAPMTLERLAQLMENSWPENYTDELNKLLDRLDVGLKAEKDAADRLLKRLRAAA